MIEGKRRRGGMERDEGMAARYVGELEREERGGRGISL